MSQSIVNTGKSVRQMVLHQAQSIPEELYDVQPAPFNNTIRWNIGHIVYCLDHFLSMSFKSASQLPASYAGLFNTGTKPADWTAAPPTKEELIQQLSAQLNGISEISPDKLEEKLGAPVQMGPFRFETVGELVNFAFIHEAMHFSAIGCLSKAAQHKQ
ncbi:DinB family protein [Paenibacillus spongiae]|uniref:DinB family protein n=1 Tax=Paenibacillus spongiae TaxID=2909671 RepID=A0ABY5SD40_9BACL|nr:DinB family protein [Paenibacillus spongiae]UVI30687.1 DinB family protein [Paenibacillus spongiae]